jgi:hypothetical protein
VGVVGVMSMVGMSPAAYNGVLAVCGVVAAVAVWPLSPASLDKERPAWLFVRFGARLGLIAWALGLWWYIQPTADKWEATAMQLAGVIGGMFFLAVLASIARELELFHTARRLTSAAVLVIPVGVYTFVMPFPEDQVVITTGAFGMVAVVFLIFSILPWFWLLLQVARSVLELASESRWAAVAHADLADREARLRQRVNRPEA